MDSRRGRPDERGHVDTDSAATASQAPASAGPVPPTIINLEIRREQNAVLILDKKASDFLRVVPADFGNARRQVGHHVGMPFERLFHPVEVFRIVCEVDADECCLRMPCDDAIQRGEQF